MYVYLLSYLSYWFKQVVCVLVCVYVWVCVSSREHITGLAVMLLFL